ncbi:MAG: EscU/YscU/HrcU family type III secretion system export apparatus switch protein [Acidobacteria bacterium]|nr:EscU/YscU/HrcU family type III secretion system export apparatus switch protein [Acidobacteriota bacterium]
MADSSQKTEQPTAKRLLKAREEGNFPVSAEFVGAIQFLGFVLILGSWTSTWLVQVKATTVVLLRRAFDKDTDIVALTNLFHLVLRHNVIPVGIALGALCGLVLMTHLAVTNFGVSVKKLNFQFNRFNPVEKIKEIPKQGPYKVLECLAILVLTGAVLYVLANDNISKLASLPFAQLETSTKLTAGIVYGLLWKAAGLLLCFGVIDLFRKKQKHWKELRMSRQEIADELKEAEGNPHVRARIRRLRRDLLRRRMMSTVPTSTVVIVNPTHYAVCIRYVHESMATPIVVAKGKNYLALRIRQIAGEHQIPLVENPPLAQSLYKSVEVGQEIPPLFYRAIAEVLAYVYQMMERARQVRRS